jgi:hypothetical protein
MAGFLDNAQEKSFLGVLYRNLGKISKFGMQYEDMVIRNSQAIGATESTFFNNQGTGFTENDAFFWTLGYQDTRIRKYIAYFDKDYLGKREFLRKFALNGEIDFILDTVTDDAINYDDKNFFCYPSLVNIELKDNVRERVEENFRTLYNLFGFQQSILAWQYFKQFLVDGFLAFEIVYSTDGKKIVGFKELDATSLQPATEKQPNGEFQQIWIQYPQDNRMTRKLKSEQVIYLSYAKGNAVSRVSYTERLIRSYNILRVMENTRVIWNVMNASYRLKFIIPVGTQSMQKGMQTLGQLMSQYKEEIQINDTSGELTVNGAPRVQFYKNYLFPEKDGESPDISTLNPSGPDFNVMENVVYFYNKLKLDSKIPYARFSARSGTPANYQISIDQLERDEIRYEKFVTRLRSVFQEILVKPLYIQMCLDFPVLSKDRTFKVNLGLDYVKENVFEQMIQLSNYSKRASFISSMGEIKMKVGEEELPYFDKEWLIKRWLGLSMDEYRMNEKYKKEEKEEADKLKKDQEKEGEKKGEGGEGQAETPSFTL